MTDPEVAAGIIGFILGCGLTIIIGMMIRILVRKITRKTPPRSQYYMESQDGIKTPIDEDDGEI